MSQTEKCLNCDGEGVVHTGVDEAPTTICPACDGDGAMDVFVAPAVANAAPELPQSEFSSWLLNGRVVNAFNHGVRQNWDHDGYWSAKGYRKAPLFTEDQVRQACAVAASAAPNAALVEALQGLYDLVAEEVADGEYTEQAIKARAALAAAGVKP